MSGGAFDARRSSGPAVFLMRALLAAGVLAWAIAVSDRGRNQVDWIVFALVAAALLWNLVGFGAALLRWWRAA